MYNKELKLKDYINLKFNDLAQQLSVEIDENKKECLKCEVKILTEIRNICDKRKRY